jgi:flagellar biogenesis protein FliO
MAFIAVMLPSALRADDASDVVEYQPLRLQYSVQPGEILLAPSQPDVDIETTSSPEPVVTAAFWQAALSPLIPNQPDASPAAAEAVESEAMETANGGLFADVNAGETMNWSASLDDAAEDRVTAAIRATGIAIVALGVLLVGFLGWQRLRGSRMPLPVESSQLLERGRLPITQTCRLHLVRAGQCDVLVAVDRGTVKAMTPLPADFSQLTASPFDALAEPAAA